MDLNEQIICLSETAKVPQMGTVMSACRDLYAAEEKIIPAGGFDKISTDIAIAWDNPAYYIQLLSRSGLALKSGITVEGGVIDIDYRQKIMVILMNHSDKDFVVRVGDRIAQFLYLKKANFLSEVVSEFSIEINSDRQGGLGSTGI